MAPTVPAPFSEPLLPQLDLPSNPYWTEKQWCGPIWGLGGGNGIGCPPISRFGTKTQRQKWLPKVARGEFRFCLGITEPDGGSDVASIKTTAQKDGSIYRVSGQKKWITNGIWCDYCTAAVRTGG